MMKLIEMGVAYLQTIAVMQQRNSLGAVTRGV